MLKLNELKSLTIDDFSMILSGMSVYFNAPPVMIAGVFVHEDTSTYEAYKGGLAVSILPYTLLAVGEYEHTFDPDLKSVFVFARLDGPLFTLEFAAISGVEAGKPYLTEQRTCNRNMLMVMLQDLDTTISWLPQHQRTFQAFL